MIEFKLIKLIKGPVADCYCSQLPTSCETVMLRTCDAISSDHNLGINDAACIFFPANSKIKVNIFSLDETNIFERSQVIDWIRNCSEFKSSEKSKCIMVFSDRARYRHAIKMLRTIKYK